ncbi:MAG TPA: hypothetical protein PLQ56_12920 [Aggregatilineales bacterium]|nr:hypothetical protein [Aggregatilineales bacterium]
MSLLKRLRPWMVVLILSLIYLGAVLMRAGGDWLTFVTLDACFATCSGNCPTTNPGGYDGQFAYYIARDPGGAAPCQDVPAYRYQRILLPILGWVLSAGNEALIPLALIAINLTALVGSVAVLERLLVQMKVSRWHALVYGLFVGVFMSVRLSTTEPLAYGLVIIAIWLGMQGRTWLEPLAWLAAGLAKEMTLIFLGAAVLHHLWKREWSRALRLALLTGIPYALWQVFLRAWLGSFGVGSGGADNTPFEIIPFMGLIRVWTEGDFRLFLLIAAYTVPAVILPALWGLWHTGREILRGEAHPYAFYLLANAAIMLVVPFSTYREPLGMMRFIVGLVLTVLLFGALRFPRGRVLMTTWVWLALNVYLLADFQAT